MQGDEQGEPRQAAIRLLARREHSQQELRRKLTAKGFEAQQVDELIARLLQEGLLSDARFTESFVRSRADRGWGPLRIRAQLQERGVGEELIDAFIDERAGHWQETVRAVRAKRFGESPPARPQERAKQIRFLQYRGFTADQIRDVLECPQGDT